MSALVKALALALPMVEGAIRDADNPHLKRKYADLGSVIAAIRPVTQHGLWFRQQNVQAHGAAVETFYVHTSGEEKSAGIIEVPVNKADAQGYGSALTYARRYGLMAAFGIAPEDDDGHAATVAKPKRAEPAAPVPEPVDVADFALRWPRMLELSDTLQALDKLKTDTIKTRAAIKEADPAVAAQINAAYKARQQVLMAANITQAG